MDARLQGGPVSLWGEFLEAREERKGQGPTQEDLPDVYGRGCGRRHVAPDGRAKGPHRQAAQRAVRRPGGGELFAHYEELWFDDVSNRASRVPEAGRATAAPRASGRSRADSAGGRPRSCASRATFSSSATTTRCGPPSRARAATTCPCSAGSRCTCRDAPRSPPRSDRDPRRRLCARGLRRRRRRAERLFRDLDARSGGAGGRRTDLRSHAPARRADRDRPFGVAGAARELPERRLLRGQLQRRRRGGRPGRDPLARRRLAQRGEARAEGRLQQVRAVAGVLRLQDARDRQPDAGREHAARAARVPGVRGDGHRRAPQRARAAHRQRPVLGNVRARRARQQAVPQEPARRGERHALRLRVARVLRLPLARRGSRGVRAAAVPARDQREPPRRGGRPGGLRPGDQRDALSATPRRSPRASTSTAS